MGLPPADGLAVLYVLADQWTRERQLLAALGVKETDSLDNTLERAATSRRSTDPAQRARDIAEFVTAAGGEVGG